MTWKNLLGEGVGLEVDKEGEKKSPYRPGITMMFDFSTDPEF